MSKYLLLHRRRVEARSFASATHGSISRFDLALHGDENTSVFFAPEHPDRTLIQLGFALSGSTVSELSIGGPAYTSRQLSVGDVILEVDNIQATEANINHLLRGCDVPGSPVMIMAAKGGVQVFDCISCVSYLTIAKTYRVHVSTSRLFEWHLKT